MLKMIKGFLSKAFNPLTDSEPLPLGIQLEKTCIEVEPLARQLYEAAFDSETEEERLGIDLMVSFVPIRYSKQELHGLPTLYNFYNGDGYCLEVHAFPNGNIDMIRLFMLEEVITDDVSEWYGLDDALIGQRTFPLADGTDSKQRYHRTGFSVAEYVRPSQQTEEVVGDTLETLTHYSCEYSRSVKSPATGDSMEEHLIARYVENRAQQTASVHLWFGVPLTQEQLYIVHSN